MLFQRKTLLDPLVKLCLEPQKKGENWVNSHYIRGPAGSGKTVLLELLRRELLKHSQITVYHFQNAKALDRFDQQVWKALLASAEREPDRRLVVVVDEVQDNVRAEAWSTLRESSGFPNFVVVGFGIKPLMADSPVLFQDKWPVSNIYLTSGRK